ncbi:helix-turn-helix transcriptional regulator [Herbiconiux sp. UC225_62]|uniref:helix-turn-helix transcriptional regulator n=1 Tax=Herbiconiux sp. UC225_62 TaxID=3350168 RepID=UPI0036D2EE52
MNAKREPYVTGVNAEHILSGSLLDSRALAAYLNVSVSTLSRMRHDGTGPSFILIRGVARYRMSAINSWIENREAGSAA